MGLLNRTKKPPKMICPACGKPNEPSLIDSGPRRCKICRTILPQLTAGTAAGISLGGEDTTLRGPAGVPAPPTEPESFDMNGLSMTTFAKAPQGRAALQEPAEPESFDIGGLEIGEPALPEPSSND